MLVVLCGKMGAGKSTKAAELARARNAVLLSEDEWLEKLYPGEIRSLADYIEYAKRLKPIVKKLVQDLLIKGLTVVMDFPANTVEQRAWFEQVTKYFVSPGPEEDFHLVRIVRDSQDTPSS